MFGNTPIIAISTVRAAEGELVELGFRKSGKKAEAATQADREDFYREMKWQQLRKGYASGWSYHKFLEKFKEKPPRWFETLEPREPSIGTLNWIKSRAIAFAKRRAV